MLVKNFIYVTAVLIGGLILLSYIGKIDNNFDGLWPLILTLIGLVLVMAGNLRPRKVRVTTDRGERKR